MPQGTVVVEREGEADASVAIEGGCVNVEHLLKAVHAGLRLPQDVHAYVMKYRGEILHAEQTLEELDIVGLEERISLDISHAVAAENRLKASGITPENIRARLDDALRSGDDDLLRTMVAAGGFAWAHMRVAVHSLVGDPARLEVLLAAGCGEDQECISAPLRHEALCETPLMRAATLGCDASVAMLIRCGVDINVWSGTTALINASRCGRIDVVQRLLAHGANVTPSSSSPEGTALQHAVARGWLHVVECLLEAGADPNTGTQSGLTSVMIASCKGRAEILALLLRHGGDPGRQDTSSEDSLVHALSGGHADIVEALVSWTTHVGRHAAGSPSVGSDVPESEPRGLDLRVPYNRKSKRTHLMLAVSAQTRVLRAVKVLVQGGADINAFDTDGRTVMMHAVLGGWVEAVKFIADCGADVRAKDTAGCGCLSHAVLQNAVDCVEHLLAAGTDVRETDVHGRTPLVHAASKGYAGLVRLLLSNGADLEGRDRDGWTCLMHACARGRVDVVNILLDEGADLHVVDKAGQSCLHVAPAEVVLILLGRGGAGIRHAQP